MSNSRPDFLKMIRAPFLSSIIFPLSAGSWVCFYVTGIIDVPNLLLVFIMGICLHIATNVYNDIYDTLQGTDKINANRNEFSGGSGVLVDFPDLLPVMYRIARCSLIGALIAAVLLFARIHDSLQIVLVLLFLFSVFFSKYYTAAPIKLAYRGLGEFFVWLAFGPMAVLVAAVSQNVGLHKIVMIAMPIPGISTLSILLIGQMIDVEADKATGKWGVAVRLGNKATSYVYLFVQIFLCMDVMVLSLFCLRDGWILLMSLIPYVFLMPKVFQILVVDYDHSEPLKKGARMNVFLHLVFSLLFIVSLTIILALQ
jgi:1,4-dihydroxy-2-naphthoate octaprenyltransferase